jgi:hypothetical protein
MGDREGVVIARDSRKSSGELERMRRRDVPQDRARDVGIRARGERQRITVVKVVLTAQYTGIRVKPSRSARHEVLNGELISIGGGRAKLALHRHLTARGVVRRNHLRLSGVGSRGKLQRQAGIRKSRRRRSQVRVELNRSG